MTPIKQGRFEFKKDSLIIIRKQMGKSQTDMAELLDVPANTLSRWETGATVPDANSLAAIYSVAKEHGLKPVFFGARGEGRSKPLRNRLLVMWDFQTAGVSRYNVAAEDAKIDAEMDTRFGEMAYATSKAFVHTNQGDSAAELERVGWRVWEGGPEIREDIIQQAKSDCGQDPGRTILVLISMDEGFIELLEELHASGVQVFVMSPTYHYSALAEKVDQKFKIPWNATGLDMRRR